ncbi:MAG: phage tail tape measure protein, partial [Alphaproteobacteria bacterium]
MDVGKIKAGEAYVEIGANTADLKNKLADARKSLKAFGARVAKIGAGLTAAGAAIAAPLVKSLTQFSSYGDQMAKAARRTGLSARSMAQFSHVAGLAGTSAEAFEISLRGMQRALYDASRGSAEVVDALESLGLTYDDLKRLSTEERFTLLADRLSKVADSSLKAGMAMKLFGRSGTQLIPLFDMGGDAIRKAREEADALGVTLGEKASQGSEELTDDIFRLKQSLLGLKIAIAEELLPTALRWLRKLKEITISIREWVSANPQLVSAVARLSA